MIDKTLEQRAELAKKSKVLKRAKYAVLSGELAASLGLTPNDNPYRHKVVVWDTEAFELWEYGYASKSVQQN